MNKESMLKRFFLSILFILVGCKSSPSTHNAPIPDDFPVSIQQYVQAVEHWSNISQDLVNQTVNSLEKHKLSHVPLYIKHPPVKSEFAVAFHDFLIDGMVKKGIKVNRVNSNNIVFEYKIQSIAFNSDRYFPSLNKFGEETELANGLVVRRNVSESNTKALQNNSNESASHSSGNRAPKLELLISSAIVDKNVYLMKTTDIYYANQDDSTLYRGGRNETGARKKVFDDAFYHQ